MIDQRSIFNLLTNFMIKKILNLICCQAITSLFTFPIPSYVPFGKLIKTHKYARAHRVMFIFYLILNRFFYQIFAQSLSAIIK